METTVTVKASTVEEAVAKALSILNATREEVSVTIITQPSKGIFGIAKHLAEVKVTKKPLPQQTLDEVDAQLELIDKIVSEVDSSSLLKKKEVEVVDIQNDHGARIFNGKVEIKTLENKFPVIIIGKGVKVTINGDEILTRKIVSEADKVYVTTEDILSESTFRVMIDQSNMEATLELTPGFRVKRTLEDTEWEETLTITAKEEKLPSNDLSFETIMQTIRPYGIQFPIDEKAILDALEKGEPCKILIAKGKPPENGIDGDLDIIYNKESNQKVTKEDEKIDFREKTLFDAVEEGNIVLKVLPPTLGRPGKDLFGSTVLPRDGAPLELRLGKNVIEKDGVIVATLSGRPIIERRGRVVKIAIMNELVHQGNVSMESGNIRFLGDVTIRGDVEDGMVVEAAGKVIIEGNCTKSTVTTSQSVLIRKNVFTSTVSVGVFGVAVNELLPMLERVADQLTHMREAIRQIMASNNQTSANVDNQKIQQLIRLIQDRKFPHLHEQVNTFVQKIHVLEKELEEEWLDAAERMKLYFLSVSHEASAKEYSALVDEVVELYDMYRNPDDSDVILSLAYSINSKLFCSGDIAITGQGAYNSTIQAGGSVKVAKICRGGEIIAGKVASFDELGSDVAVKTIVRVPEDGVIHANRIYQGVEIHIGKKVHTFAREEYKVHARISDDGLISLK